MTHLGPLLLGNTFLSVAAMREQAGPMWQVRPLSRHVIRAMGAIFFCGAICYVIVDICKFNDVQGILVNLVGMALLLVVNDQFLKNAK